jgi:protein-disulfide isomerase
MQQKADARQRRDEEQRARRRRAVRTRLAIIVAGALTLTAGAVAVSRLGHDKAVASPAAVSARFAGLEQDGIRLGEPSAPVTLIEFADLQCPFCGQYAREVLPTVIDRYVRTGRLALELNLLTFVGEDSVKGARVAAAATRQQRFWDFTDAFYAAQGPENSGYVTDEFLERTTGAAGVDLEAARAAGPTADRVLGQAQRAADRLGATSTPMFFLRRGHDETPLVIEDLSAETFTAALDEALR